MFKNIISTIAIRYLPESIFAPLYTMFWDKNTRIERLGWRVRRGGLDLLIPTPKCLFMRYKEWEDKFERFFKIERGDTAVDIGACFGDTAVPMAMKVGIEGRVIAVEPSPVNAQFLRLNLQGFGNCEVIEKAMWNEKGEVTFWLHKAPTGGSIEHAYERNFETKVMADTVDNILDGVKVDFLKIDVQGSEVQVLEGAKKTLSRVPKCIVETHYRNTPARTYPDVMKIMEGFGFKLNFTMDNGLVYAERKGV